jgi:N-acetylglucosaminyl-diphospho-decaprenol L-rhamnosyltransferase
VNLLSIVIVSFNARADLVACLRSLRDAPPAIDHEIVVVDNGSADGSVEAAMAIRGARVLPLGRNSGFAAANNVGIRESRGDMLLLLNSDTIVPGGAIDALVARFHAVDNVGVAGPRLVDAAGRPELSFGRMISPLHEFLQQRRTPGWIAAETAREQFVDWVSGACLLVGRGDAEAVGLLDERFFLYTEDVDFCHAIRARGRRILFTPAAEVVHLRGRSRASQPAASRTRYRESHLAFYRKHHPWLVPLLRLYLRLKGESTGVDDPNG